jgi:hypothetical protein
MSALGQKQTLGSEIVMSALPPKADIAVAQLIGEALVRRMLQHANDGRTISMSDMAWRSSCIGGLNFYSCYPRPLGGYRPD